MTTTATNLYSSIAAYHQALTAGATSCVAAVQYYLESIQQQNHLNAFTQVFGEEALAKASQLDESRKAGKTPSALHGVVIAIKDVICYKDHPVTAASGILEGFESVYHATAVQRLLDAEAIIIGMCNCDEFAMGSSNENSVYGKVLNALDNSKVPGGSSGGSAVAVQAHMCMLSLGSDTGGSVRQPADFCGIIGLKPSYGAISRYGLIAYASSFDQIGIFGKDLADVALLLNIMQGPDAYDSTALQTKKDIHFPPNAVEKKYTIAYFDTALNHPSLDPEIRSAILDTINQMRSEGHKVEPVSFDLIDYVVPAYYVLTTAEASSNLSRFDGVRYGHRTKENVEDLTDFYKKSRTEGFGKEVQRRILLGTFVLSAGYFDAYFTKAQQVRRLLVNQTEQIFAQYDALLMPTVPTTAFGIGAKTSDPVEMYIADIYTVFANLAGLPAISIPLYQHSNGMPFGLQVLTNKSDEQTLIDLSDYLLENASTTVS